MFVNNITKFVAVLVFPIFLLSCRGVSFSEVHYIKIDYYESQADNEKLAEEIFNYGPQYIMENIPSFTNEMAKGIKIGYSLPSQVEKTPNFQYTLKLNVPAVAKHKEALKSEFEEFIPKLVETHVSKKGLYERYAPRAEKWLISVFLDPLDRVYPKTSNRFKSTTTEAEFIDLANQYKTIFGPLKQTNFTSGYYVENDKTAGEVLVIMFSQTFESGKVSKSQVVFTREGENNWGVSGYKIHPVN